MATPGKPLDRETVNRLRRLIESHNSRRTTAREAGVCKRTVDKYAKKLRG